MTLHLIRRLKKPLQLIRCLEYQGRLEEPYVATSMSCLYERKVCSKFGRIRPEPHRISWFRTKHSTLTAPITTKNENWIFLLWHGGVGDTAFVTCAASYLTGIRVSQSPDCTQFPAKTSLHNLFIDHPTRGAFTSTLRDRGKQFRY